MNGLLILTVTKKKGVYIFTYTTYSKICAHSVTAIGVELVRHDQIAPIIKNTGRAYLDLYFSYLIKRQIDFSIFTYQTV